MKQSIDNVEMLQLLEKKQKLLLGIKVAITLDRMDLVRKLAGELRIITAVSYTHLTLPTICSV